MLFNHEKVKFLERLTFFNHKMFIQNISFTIQMYLIQVNTHLHELNEMSMICDAILS